MINSGAVKSAMAYQRAPTRHLSNRVANARNLALGSHEASRARLGGLVTDPVHHHVEELAGVATAQAVPTFHPDQLFVRRRQFVVVVLDQRGHRIDVVAADEEVHRHLQLGRLLGEV